MIWAAVAFLTFFIACVIFSAVGLWYMGDE
jgi:hypothetical protein